MRTRNVTKIEKKRKVSKPEEGMLLHIAITISLCIVAALVINTLFFVLFALLGS